MLADLESNRSEELPKESIWRSARRLWCRHPHTIITPRTGLMPPHVVCQSCGWREPALAVPPRATRTWDSTRDEGRYAREKKRRTALESQKQSAVSQLAAPAPRQVKLRRVRQGNVVEMKRAQAR